MGEGTLRPSPDARPVTPEPSPAGQPHVPIAAPDDTGKLAVEGRVARHAVLADGAVVTVRRLGPDDRAAVAALHRALPLDDSYLRFFSVSRPPADRIAEIVVADAAVALGAFQAERLLGVAHYQREPTGITPEVAVVVAHDAQHRGVASLLLEHLATEARAEGVTALTADVLVANRDMLKVLRDSGLPMRDERDVDVYHLILDLAAAGTPSPEQDRYLEAVAARAAQADAASLRPLLRPRSVAVVGAGRRADSVGRAVVHRIVEGGYPGVLHTVHPDAVAVMPVVPCVRTVHDLPEGVELAVLAVPAAAVPALAEECGRHGIRALLVLTAGITGDARLSAALQAAVHRHGMRLVGPNCLGLVNTDDPVRLQATFGPLVPAGGVGLAAQSGGILIALTSALARLGLGVSTAVSTGDAADVNADDLLLWWSADAATRSAVVHVESLRRPRQFARLARRLARQMPVLTIRSGSSAVGRRAVVSHSASSATPRVVRDALFAQAGVLAVDELTDLVGLLALLDAQPLPRGPRVAVVSNAGGAGVLAADACAAAGLEVATTAEPTRVVLAALLPPTAALGGPVDTTAAVSAAVFRQVLDVVVADPGVDAVLAIGVPTAVGGPLSDLGSFLDRRSDNPVVLVRPDQAEAVRADREGSSAWTPSFAEPAVAGRALAVALRRSRWLDRPRTALATPPRVDAARARRVVTTAFSADPAGGWLDPVAAVELLAAAGVPVVTTTVVGSAGAAMAARRTLGRPVALKANVAGLVHRTSAGAVRTGLDSADSIVEAVDAFRQAFGPRLRGIVVQPMADPGLELLVGVTTDPLCGPLLTHGLGGVATDLVEDRSHCLVPATDADLADLLDGLRASEVLRLRDDAAALRAAVGDVAARLAWLAELLAELAEVEVNPLVWANGAAVAVDVRARLAPADPSDPFIRALPS